MIYQLNSKVQIGDLVLQSSSELGNVHQIKINRSVETYTATAVIEIPRNLTLRDRRVEDYIKEGDAVTIELGYNGELATEFTGYVRRVSSGYPVKVYCEDQMYLLKEKVEDQSWQQVTLGELISFIAPNFEHEIVDSNLDLGKFTIHQMTGLDVLEKLKEKYGLFSYFLNEVLHIGFRFSNQYQTHTYDFAINVAAHSLSFKSKEDSKIKVVAISHLKNGKKLKVEKGDKNGAIRTLNYFNKTKAELEQLATLELDQWKFEGVSGNITGFGVPKVDASDVLTLQNSGEGFNDFRGDYTVQSIEVTYGLNGFKRVCELGYKV